MKKFTFLSVALLLAASQAMAQFSTSPLVPQLKQESTGLNIAAKAPTKVKAQVPEAPISDRPAGKAASTMLQATTACPTFPLFLIVPAR